jgi:hypothetical protein
VDEDDLGLVAESLTEATAAEFAARAESQAADLKRAIASGEFDSPGFAVGLEMEVYAVDGDGRLAPLPDRVFEGGANKELGLHNAELNTDPDPLHAAGLAAQAEEIRERTQRAREGADEAGLELVLDAMWTVPPAEGSRAYLEATRDHGAGTGPEGRTDETGEASDSDEPTAVPENMRPDPRYLAIDADIREAAGGDLPFAVPGADTAFPSILFESLATSIQPHLQVPDAGAFPDYYNAAIRTLGPVLALSANSPFLPPDLYTDADDPEGLVAETPHELRIEVFEQSVNHTPSPKVRVPSDIADAGETADRVVADDLVAPFLREWLENGERVGLEDDLWEFAHKRSTYWRWLRCVAGGQPVGGGDERSLRIEYRPIPTQPTVRDVVGIQALTAGLVRGLVAADHPIAELPWSAAEESFYSAVSDGIRADLAWVTAGGERTGNADLIFDEVFAHARRGLREAGLPEEGIEFYLEPVEARRYAAMAPSDWKKQAVRERLADGADLAGAITGMQREYIRLSRETETFAEWL